MISSTDEQQQKIEAYLAKLRGRLRGLNEHEVHEIIRELRAHIADKTVVRGGATTFTVDLTLDALGSPEALANQYLTVALSRERRSTAHRSVSYRDYSVGLALVSQVFLWWPPQS
jgi:uncharacterized membrane protein